MILLAIANFVSFQGRDLMVPNLEPWVSMNSNQVADFDLNPFLIPIENHQMYQDSVTNELTSKNSDIIEFLTNQALEELYEHLNSESYRFNVSPGWLPGSLTQVSPEDIISFNLKSNIERYTIFEVAYKHRKSTQKVEIQLSIEIEKMLPVASKRIVNGDVIEVGDIDMRWVSVPHDRGQLVSEADLLHGKTIRRTLNNGQPIRYADISTDLIIEAGDEVQLIFENHGIQIHLTVEARQSGALDEEIKFYSSETKKRYEGKIVGPGAAIWKRTL
ncbi:MAG: flagellar basal body P-ring formation chaperone FlgA [Balneolaceae bacterium]